MKYRVIILGAGFSKPAGLPLAYELWDIILKRAKHLWGRADKLNDDIESYIAFRRDCDGIELTREGIDFEEFLGFLDIEHYLGLRGSDTWSNDGNEGQVVIKTLIGEILSSYMSQLDSIPELYLEFARRLQPQDYILTFNYDVLLERALDAVGKKYRLFPTRYSSVSRFSGTVDNNNEEVTILKMHGSIDWFDKSRFIDNIKFREKEGLSTLPSDPVFNGVEDWGITQIVDGPRHKGDPLLNIHKVSRIEDLYKQNLMFMATPWILTPSTNKILYASTVEEFWRGLGRAGGSNFGMSIIGYSLPDHDSYARQTMYSLSSNYQTAYWDKEISGMKKHPLVLVDYKSTKRGINEFLNNYRFLDKQKTELHMDGFNITAIEKIFK
ncbi:MAG: SIR2 family protein [Deltaproteobacteria bacterium]|nr:SIR2 family protein [Deltaproteobacteria bacterium]